MNYTGTFSLPDNLRAVYSTNYKILDVILSYITQADGHSEFRTMIPPLFIHYLQMAINIMNNIEDLTLLLRLHKRHKRGIKSTKNTVRGGIIASKQPILFMFLGGLPYDEHWMKFINEADDSLYIIVHPQALGTPDSILKNDTYKKMYERKRIYIVDDAHHVATSWATFSLISATLLMMQYMLLMHGNIFKKYILLSGNDKPLYNYYVMHSELVSDNKSWFYYSNDSEGLSRSMMKKIYDYQGGIFTINDVSYVSQWCGIDQTHIKYYFDENMTNLKTYEKKPQKECNGRTQNIKSISSNPIFQQYINSHVGTWNGELSKSELEEILKNGLCVTADETFFGVILRHNVRENFLDHVKHDSISSLNMRSENEFIANVGDEDFYLNKFKCIYANKNSESTTKTLSQFRLWYGNYPSFNNNNLLYRIFLIKNKNSTSDDDKYFIVKNNTIITVSLDTVIKMKNNPNDPSIYLNLSGGEIHNINADYIDIYNNVPKTENFSDYYTISTTYTDWSSVNANPSNMFRDFNSSIFHPSGKSFFNKSLLDEISVEPVTFITNLINKSPIIINPEQEFVKGPSYHPAEYTTYSLLEILNSYNSIVFFDVDDRSKNSAWFENDYKNAKKIYKNIIDNNKEHIIEYNIDNKIYYVFNSAVSVDIKNKKYGHPITSVSLNNALNYGALFIRKVMNDSQLELYTDQLYNLKSYAPKTTSPNKRRIFNSDDIIMFGGSKNIIYRLQHF